MVPAPTRTGGRVLAALLGVLLLTPWDCGVLAAQSSNPAGEAASADEGWLLLSLTGRSTRVRSQAKILVGGDLRVRLPGSFSAGLGAWGATSATTVPGGSTGVDYGMEFAYGGIVVERGMFVRGSTEVGARLTFGAGSARASLPGVNGSSAADNFGVVEAEAVVSRHLPGAVGVRAQLGYRLSFGVEDLPQTVAAHFRGITVSLGFVLGPW